MNGSTESKVMGIRDVVRESGLCENYVRKAIRAGKLVVTKGRVPGTDIPKNYIAREDYEAWRAGTASATKREDGRNKFVMYMTADEEMKVRELLAGMPEIESLIARANKKAESEIEAE